MQASGFESSHRFAVAPMLDWTDRHFRYFLRLLTQRALLYSEMVTTGAVLYGDRERLLGFDPLESPVVCQLGGSDPKDLGEAAAIAESFGYSELNLNVGCPSDRVQKGRFGACLMAEPHLVADCVAAMAQRVQIPVTVKTRIGIDDQDSYEALCHFIETVAGAGVKTFTIHARKAWLSGLSPRENREVPPLRYDVAASIKRDFGQLNIILNGGIQSIEEAEAHLKVFDGVMLGRAAYHDPYLLADVDRRIFGEYRPVPSREDVMEAMLPYIEGVLRTGARLNTVTRHMLGLYHGRPGGRIFRRRLGEMAVQKDFQLSDFSAFVAESRSRIFGTERIIQP
jgi:tRNA-dihydrouridine synthase A